ncbi:hypothetical protein PENSPDRAFT_88535 [Peniophora sp. CONT]|nr:hypothetical protein PENSPDRAFT_88535 [Peniophora sp. CONT]
MALARARVAADSDHHPDFHSRPSILYTLIMTARIPYDVWIDILGNVEETKDLAHCVVVNSLMSQAALPVLYRTIRVKYVDLDGRTGVSMIHSNNAFVTLKAHPHLLVYVKEIRFHVYNRLHNARYTVHDSGAPVDVMSTLFNLTACTIWSPTDNIISSEVLHDIISKLRLCHNLTHLHWDFGITRQHMPILNRLRANTTLRLRSLTLGDASTEAIRSLDVILRSFDELTSLRLQSSAGLDVALSQDLVANGALSRLEALQIGFSHTLPAPALLSFVSAGSNLTELDVVYDYFLLGRDRNTPLPDELGLSHLKSLVVRHQGVADVNAFHELFSWVSRLAAKSPLQHLNVVSDDCKRHGCKGGACLATVARQHPTLVSLSAAHVYLGAAFISLVAKACPLLEDIECAPPKPPRVRRLTSGPTELVRCKTESSLAAIRGARSEPTLIMIRSLGC